MASKGTIGIVVRVSDVKGRDKRGDRFISPAEQIAKASPYCHGDGYDVLVIEPMDLNVPHKTPLDERPGMSEALRMVESGELAGIGVSSQDRIGTLAIMRELKKRLLDAGAVLKVADNPSAEVLDARGYMKLPAEYMSLMHEAQREEIGLRWASAQRNARERGVLPEREPFGYARAEDGRVVLDRRDAKVMLDVFERRASGEPFASIGRSYGWSHSTTRQRVMNRSYTGVPGLIPQLVTPELWERANATKTVRPVPPGVTTMNLLVQGLARCAGCGYTLKLPRPNLYYCKDAASEPCQCRAAVQADALDAFVAEWFGEALRGSGRMVDVVEAAHELEQAQAERDRAEEELAAYVEDTDASLPGYKRGLDKRTLKWDEAKAHVREIQGRVAKIPAGGSLVTLWDSFAVEERRDVLRGFLDRIEVSKGATTDLAGNVRIYWADGSLAYPVEAPQLERRFRVAAA
jgi:DNA invertase Pin-like site-specific DNA recombinase